MILTSQEDPNLAGEAIRGGAAAYVPKTAAGRQLLRAIRMAAEGNTYLEPQLGARLAADNAAAKLAAPELTERELEVLRLIARGHTNRETAERLFLSVRTVENTAHESNASSGAQAAPTSSTTSSNGDWSNRPRSEANQSVQDDRNGGQQASGVSPRIVAGSVRRRCSSNSTAKCGVPFSPAAMMKSSSDGSA